MPTWVQWSCFVLVLISMAVYAGILYGYWVSKKLGLFGHLPPVVSKWVGFLAIPSVLLFLPSIIQFKYSDGTTKSLLDVAPGIFQTVYGFAVLFVSTMSLWIMWYCLSQSKRSSTEPVHPDLPPPGAVTPLDAVAYFKAKLYLPFVLTEKLSTAYAGYLLPQQRKYYETREIDDMVNAVRNLVHLVPNLQLLGEGETTLHELLYGFVRDTTKSQTQSYDAMEVLSLGDFKNHFYDVKVGYALPDNLRTQHHQIIANSGHGKTQCIQSMIMDDWNTDASIVVIDSQGDLINNLLAHCPHLDRVVLIDPETCPPAMNIFANKAKGEYELATAIELFEYIFSALDVKLTGQQSLVYRYLSRLLMDIPGATIETMRDLLQPGGTDPYQTYINQLGGNAKAFFDEFQKDKNNQYAETKQAVLRRLLMVLESETFSKMLASEKMAFDFPDLLDSGKIILISTSKRLLKDGSSLFGRIFIALVMQAVMARKGNRRRTYMYIDEFADYAEDSKVLFNLFEQARKYELGMVVCHQYLGQLPQQLSRSLSANTAIKFAGGVSAEDARALASQMQTKPEAIQAEPQLSFHAWFKGQRVTSWKVQPGRLEALPRHSERELDQFRDQMRMMYGARRGNGRPAPPPPEPDNREPDAW